jgi:hypothetical protein
MGSHAKQLGQCVTDLHCVSGNEQQPRAPLAAENVKVGSYFIVVMPVARRQGGNRGRIRQVVMPWCRPGTDCQCEAGDSPAFRRAAHPMFA